MVRTFIKTVVFCLAALLTQAPIASALSDAQTNLFNSGIYFFDAGVPECGFSVSLNSTSNIDYAGRSILKQGELQALSANTATYQQAAQQVGIPWQVLAAAHYREHDFSTVEPNSRPIAVGVYQITDNQGNIQKYNLNGPNYPSDGQQLTSQQFLNQSIDAANFIKSDGAGLGASSQVGVVKDSFVKYNGEPQKYIDQATALGYSSSQGYEGSPYVMNIADPPRDPTNGPLNSWLQDSGGGNFKPATADQYGAYIVYASISGLSIGTGSCSSVGVSCSANSTQNLSQVRQAVVCLAEQEYAKWQTHQLNPGSGYLTYSQNNQWDWCADFVSWVYDQAGYPLHSDPNWREDSVHNIHIIGEQNQNFHWHLSSGYIPKPGDLAIHNDGQSDFHINIVTGTQGNQLTLLGGNQGSNDFNQSSVTQYTSDLGDIIGFVTPD